MKTYFSPKEVANILNVHEKTIRRYLRDGVLKGQKLGGSWKISNEVLMDYMDQKEPVTMDGLSSVSMKSGKVTATLLLDVQVKHAKEGHKIAKQFMNLIHHKGYESCQFNYQMENGKARFRFSGCSEFLSDALKIVEGINE